MNTIESPQFTPTLLEALRTFRRVHGEKLNYCPVPEGDFWNYLAGFVAAEELEAQPQLLGEIRRRVDRNLARNFTCAEEIAKRLDSGDPLGEVLKMLRSGNAQLALSGFPWTVFSDSDEWENLKSISYYFCPLFLYDPHKPLPDGRSQDEA